MFQIFADGEVLYRPGEDARLVLTPHLVLEMGKAGSLTFGLPPGNALYHGLRKLRTIITVEMDGVEIFRGRVLTDDRGFQNVKTVYCEGCLSYLIDSVQKAEAYTGTTHGLFSRIVAAHNARVEEAKHFKVGRVTIEDRPVVIAGESEDIEDAETGAFYPEQIAIGSMVNEWKNSYDYIEACLIDFCGGYLRVRKESDGLYLDYGEDYGNAATQSIEFGVNLLDLTERISAEKLFTVLIPLGDENLTIESVNGGSDELADAEAVATYGRIVRTHIFDNVYEPATLLENGQRYLASNVAVPTTLTMKAVDLHLLNPDIQAIYIGDAVPVHSAPHTIIDRLMCTKIEYDLMNASNNEYTFGVPEQALTQRYRKDASKARENAIRNSRGVGKKSEEAIDEFWRSWVDWDPNEPHVSLGAIARIIESGKNILQNEVGIVLDGITGNINIRTLHKEMKTLDDVIVQQAAHIDMVQQETGVYMDLIASRIDYLGEIQQEHAATIQLNANKTEASLLLKAEQSQVNKLDEDLSRNTANLQMLATETAASLLLKASTYQVESISKTVTETAAELKLLSDSTGASITLLTSQGNILNGQTASLEIKTNALENSIAMQASRIDLKADTTTLNSRVTTINGKITIIDDEIAGLKRLVAAKIDATWLNGEVAVFNSSVAAPYFNAGVNMRIDGKLVATQEWVAAQIQGLTIAWSNIVGKPQVFPSTPHKHGFSGETTLHWGHTHITPSSFKAGDQTGAVASYGVKQIAISGTTANN